jgi:acetyl-CoA synthetase
MTTQSPTGSQQRIDVLLNEKRRFSPSTAFKESANVHDPYVYAQAAENPEAFWENEAKKLHWFAPWKKVLEWTPPYAKWFVGGKLNASYNCLDRHVENGNGDKIAICFEGEPGDQQKITYKQMLEVVCRFSNGLKSLGIKKGDRVAIYMPMIPELIVSVLACARIGAVHSVVFGGFSQESLQDRIQDAEAKCVITADGGFRRGKTLPLKPVVDSAVANCPSVEKVVVVERTKNKVDWDENRDICYKTLTKDQSTTCPPEIMDAEDLLFILYTSGTTGKPKGIMHTTGGYLTQTTATSKYVFDLKDEDVYWCTADVGWITGHSYIVYGPMANGVTQVVYEGTPDTPNKNRFWEIVEKYGVSVFYTAPTAIRTFMKWGTEETQKNNLSTLRLLGTVGEPINPEAWMWYHENIGHQKCPIVDTWWQTETGGIMISPLPGITETRPGSATVAFPGISAEILDEAGNRVPPGGGGLLSITQPWPSMLRGLYKDPKRYEETYWQKFNNKFYFAGDGAHRDKEGFFWLLGRVDDVLNISGHRIGTMEVESALVSHPEVAEAAVVGREHEIKGQALCAFVTLKGTSTGNDALKITLRNHVGKVIGAIAKPDDVIFTADLPKTRSGKIMRRLLRDIAEGRALGDTTTLADPKVVEALQQQHSDE